MLDVIKELIPLLEGAKNGVVGLVAAYFGLMALKMLLVAGSVILVANWMAKFLTSWVNTGRVRRNDWNCYQWDDGEMNIDCMFTVDSMKKLLSAIANESGYVHSIDVIKAADTIRAAKK